jgi:NAD(P)-dependent dehydrogenase (short-subunit alcohol dehydrogenase family)
MQQDFKGKTALVTGASRGIGAAVAKALAVRGAKVITLARTVGGLEALDDEIKKAGGGQTTLIAADLSKLDDIDKIGPSIAERFGDLDIFIGNAGTLGPLSPVHHIKPKDWDKTFNINLHSNIRLVRTLEPLLRASEAGRVIFTTSILGSREMAYWGPYCTSKAALNMFMKTYAAETKLTNIRVNAIAPGMVDTAMLRESFPGGFQGTVKKPEDVVDPYLELASAHCAKHGEIIDLG